MGAHHRNYFEPTASMAVYTRGVVTMKQEEIDRMTQEFGWRSKLRFNLREKDDR